MDLLQVDAKRVVTADGQPIYLRGTCVGGGMNMEEFINGFPGSEHAARAIMARQLGAETAQLFFDRMLDYFFSEDDVIYLKSLGTLVVRLPLNYRHFETTSGRSNTWRREGYWIQLLSVGATADAQIS
jgi:endoglucanase